MSKVAAAAGLSTQQIVQALVQQVKAIELTPRSQDKWISSGIPRLDQILPDRGFARGSLVEWLSASPGSGTSTLALRSAVQACRAGQALVVVDREQTFYLPGTVSWGVDPARLVIVRPSSDQEEAWAIDQILRCQAVGAMLCWPRRSDDHTYRRWQLAAEAGGTLGFLIRGVAARSQPSWAELRLLVEPLSRVRATHHSNFILSAAKNLESDKILRCAPDDAGSRGSGALHAPYENQHDSLPSYDATLIRRVRVQILRCRWGKPGRSAEILLGGQSDCASHEGGGR